MTFRAPQNPETEEGPQWSPLLRSGMTWPGGGFIAERLTPQWSPLLRSGMTHLRPRRHPVRHLAALEPAPQERDD